MVEEVSTGGTKKFVYDKNHQRRLSPEERKEIQEAYRRADERKARERKNRFIFWIIVGLIVVGTAIFYFLR